MQDWTRAAVPALLIVNYSADCNYVNLVVGTAAAVTAAWEAVTKEEPEYENNDKILQ